MNLSQKFFSVLADLSLECCLRVAVVERSVVAAGY